MRRDSQVMSPMMTSNTNHRGEPHPNALIPGATAIGDEGEPAVAAAMDVNSIMVPATPSTWMQIAGGNSSQDSPERQYLRQEVRQAQQATITTESLAYQALAHQRAGFEEAAQRFEHEARDAENFGVARHVSPWIGRQSRILPI